jgi:hypothetical protein
MVIGQHSEGHAFPLRQEKANFFCLLLDAGSALNKDTPATPQTYFAHGNRVDRMYPGLPLPDRIVSKDFMPTPFGGFHQFQEAGQLGLWRLVETPIPLFWGQFPAKILVDGEESLPALDDPPAGKLAPFTFAVAEANLPA